MKKLIFFQLSQLLNNYLKHPSFFIKGKMLLIHLLWVEVNQQRVLKATELSSMQLCLAFLTQCQLETLLSKDYFESFMKDILGEFGFFVLLACGSLVQQFEGGGGTVSKGGDATMHSRDRQQILSLLFYFGMTQCAVTGIRHCSELLTKYSK